MDTHVIKLNQKNFQLICRICYEQSELKNIFLSKYRNITFASILNNFVVPQKILESDGLPPHVCLKCIKNILSAHAFLEQYKISSEALASVYKYIYKNDNGDRRKYMQITCTKLLDHDTLLEDCTFVIENNLKLDINLINTPLVKVEELEALVIKNELLLHDFDSQSVATLKTENVSQLLDPPGQKSLGKKRPAADLKLKCSDCSGLFKTQTGLASHQRANHLHYPKPNREFICAICSRSYTMKYKLRRHLTLSHKNCTCDKCGLKLKRSSLTKHLKMHEPDYVPYKPPRNRRLCTVCGASVRYHFNTHMRKHQEHDKGMKYLKGKFQCNCCSFETPHWTSLYRHKLRHKEKPFLCNTCGKEFSGKEFFDKHMRLHEPFEKSAACYVCSETFNNEFDYGKHLSTHTYYVRKTSNFEEYLKRKQKYKKRVSKKTVGEEKSAPQSPKPPKRKANPNLRKLKTIFKCAPCDKIFKDNAHLQIHVTATHENKREHKCAYCGKGFNLPYSLQEHIRTHTGETLKCDYCDKTFKQNSTRYKHLREAHNVLLGQIRKEKCKERREKDEIRKAYKKLKRKLDIKVD